MSAVQKLKSYLVTLGPGSFFVKTALGLYARRRGFQLAFSSPVIHIRRGQCDLILNDRQFVQVPVMLDCFNLFFETIRTSRLDGVDVLDFSQPALHEYVKRGVSFYFPSVPEDDVMAAYTKEYLPQPGDVVWDVGAHAGATTYFLSQLVGPTGRVYAFEPDEYNTAYLQKNLELHGLSNVEVVKKALSGTTGRATFNMDGTMSAGIHEFLVYSGTGKMVEVETISISDACAQFGCVPQFIKMDIEGAEVAAVEGSADFLSTRSVHFAIESGHRLGDASTFELLDRFFPQIGYQAKSENYCGQMFTWAKPTRA